MTFVILTAKCYSVRLYKSLHCSSTNTIIFVTMLVFCTKVFILLIALGKSNDVMGWGSVGMKY